MGSCRWLYEFGFTRGLYLFSKRNFLSNIVVSQHKGTPIWIPKYFLKHGLGLTPKNILLIMGIPNKVPLILGNPQPYTSPHNSILPFKVPLIFGKPPPPLELPSIRSTSLGPTSGGVPFGGRYDQDYD